MSWFIESKSDTHIQRTKFQSDPPYMHDTPTSQATGPVLSKKRANRPRTSDENVEMVRSCAFLRSPKKSVHLEIPRLTVHMVLHKRFRLYAYKVQFL
ncbi:unnamed protein product [Larinioides sclopetarius]|uniref:Ycf15 n=1 Tax=Larinioides sclopetarius TaxID=280406 RepID=A0AAV1Z370_9ARAC